MNSMKTIKEKFTRQGYESTLIERNEHCAIYERKDVSSRVVHFEVVRIKKHTHVRQIGEYTSNIGDEYLPSDNQWGTHGWTIPNYDRAKQKFDEVTQLVISKLN